ncbi:MAG: hypothetical protein OEY97_00670 [Nitrospirota bacterium]|nr:hypothetical protein [Nitrospirota bacterium]
MPLKVLVIDPDSIRSGMIQQAMDPDELSVVLTPTLEQGLGALLKGGFSLMMLSAGFGSPSLTAWWNQAEAVARGIPTVLLGGGDPGGVPITMVMPDPLDPQFMLAQVRDQLGIRPKPKARPAEVAPPAPPVAQEMNQAAAPVPPGDPLAALKGGGLGGSPLVSPAAPDMSAPDAPQEEFQEAGFLEPTSLDDSEAPPLEAPPAPPFAAPVDMPPIESPSAETASGEVEMEMAGMTPERIQEMVTEIARKTVEKVVWETVPPLVNQLIQEKQAEQDRVFAQIVERVVWETVPPMAESIVKQEIRRLSDGN